MRWIVTRHLIRLAVARHLPLKGKALRGCDRERLLLKEKA
jgi:hypothetical protein